MARKRKQSVHHVQMTDGKRAIIQQLFQEYDIESAEDIQDALKDLLGGTIKEMMEAEMDDHLGYEKSQRVDRSEYPDYRNGTKQKQVNSSYGSVTIDVPQDRDSTFQPKVVKKRQKDISNIDQKIISMYAKGMTTRQISETLMDIYIYGFEASEGFISDVTDKLLPQIEEWQNRPLDDTYPVLFIDAILYSVRDNGIIKKLAAYVILGINLEGRKEVLTIEVGQNESSKYWLAVLNNLKNRGVRDIMIICADGLTGIKEEVENKWSEKYPNAMKSWRTNWDAITPIFKFSADVRTIIYTTYTDKKTMPIFQRKPNKLGNPKRKYRHSFKVCKASLVRLYFSISFLRFQMGLPFR